MFVRRRVVLDEEAHVLATILQDAYDVDST